MIGLSEPFVRAGSTQEALLCGEDKHRLQAELEEVARSRARLLDAFEAERRRIERDLHDGTQERLVSLTLRLGLARLDIAPQTPAYENVAVAHDQAKQLMAELRELIRGIHPRVLSDRGLTAALGELADRSAIPVTVRADLTDRLPRHVETTAYFAATEALTNVAKHSRAIAASITVRRSGQVLVVEVFDDGAGGADPGARHGPDRSRGPDGSGRRQNAAVQSGRRTYVATCGDSVQPQRSAIRVVLAEDGVLLREGLASLLGRFGFEVVATAGDAEGLRAAGAEHEPDLVVTDIRMPPGFTDEGLRAAVELRRAHPSIAVVALSQYVELSYASDLLDSADGWGVGYLLKDRVVDVEEFAVTLRSVTAGGTVVDPQVIRQLLHRQRDPCRGYRYANARCSVSSPRATRTARSPGTWWSPRLLSASTSAASSPNSTCRRPRTPTAGSWRCSPISGVRLGERHAGPLPPTGPADIVRRGGCCSAVTAAHGAAEP